ncbi:MAG: PxKF domain-containing protein [Armatimonadota bacterium]
MKKMFMLLAALVLLLCLSKIPVSAESGWTAINLSPSGPNGWGWIQGIWGDQIVGVSSSDGPAIWNRSTLEMTDLGRGWIESVYNGYQVGSTDVVNREHAAMWNGTADSLVDLNPVGAEASGALGISGNCQVGWAAFQAYDEEGGPIYLKWDQHAGLWHGTANSWVDLHPAGAFNSFANGVSGDYQAGLVSYGTSSNNVSHAALWHGTADSFVDLHPADLWTRSGVSDIFGDYQVGWVDNGGSGNISHAAIWRKTVDSFVDLNPAGARSSWISGTCGGYVAGGVCLEGDTVYPDGRASLCSGTADSWVDLTPYLPDPSNTHGPDSHYTYTEASCVYESNGEIWVGGTAYGVSYTISDPNVGPQENWWYDPILWHYTPPIIETGTNVPVETVSGFSLTFSNVTEGGSTWADVLTMSPDPPSSGSIEMLGSVWNIESTATFTGPITIAIPYPADADPDLVQLMHYENGAWNNVTTSVDQVNHIVYGEVSSLSPFAVAEIKPVFGGFLQPINADGSSIFKLGSTIPVKFQLPDSLGGFITNIAAKIYVAKFTDDIVGSEIEAVSTSAATTGNLFRYDSTANQYVFNLSTKSMSTGAWQIRVDLGDGNMNTVNVSLK